MRKFFILLLSLLAIVLLVLTFVIGLFVGIEMAHSRAATEIATLARVEAKLAAMPEAERWREENVKQAIAGEPMFYLGWGDGWLSAYAQPGTSWCYMLVQTKDGIVLIKHHEGMQKDAIERFRSPDASP